MKETKAVRLFGWECQPASMAKAKKFVRDMNERAKGQRVILTSEEIYAARTLIPFLLERLEAREGPGA